jgi:putative DNA primase/helicase
MFLEERCVRTPNARVLSLKLYQDYKSWAEQYGETPVSHKFFASMMGEQGFQRTKTRNGAMYSGLGIRLEDHYDVPKTLSSRHPALVETDDGELV